MCISPNDVTAVLFWTGFSSALCALASDTAGASHLAVFKPLGQYCPDAPL